MYALNKTLCREGRYQAPAKCRSPLFFVAPVTRTCNSIPKIKSEFIQAMVKAGPASFFHNFII
jgi:hypothetical protein